MKQLPVDVPSDCLFELKEVAISVGRHLGEIHTQRLDHGILLHC
jgi:hypothetical protein